VEYHWGRTGVGWSTSGVALEYKRSTVEYSEIRKFILHFYSSDTPLYSGRTPKIFWSRWSHPFSPLGLLHLIEFTELDLEDE
jgi:hypothetical protein